MGMMLSSEPLPFTPMVPEGGSLFSYLLQKGSRYFSTEIENLPHLHCHQSHLLAQRLA